MGFRTCVIIFISQHCYERGRSLTAPRMDAADAEGYTGDTLPGLSPGKDLTLRGHGVAKATHEPAIRRTWGIYAGNRTAPARTLARLHTRGRRSVRAAKRPWGLRSVATRDRLHVHYSCDP